MLSRFHLVPERNRQTDTVCRCFVTSLDVLSTVCTARAQLGDDVSLADVGLTVAFRNSADTLMSSS